MYILVRKQSRLFAKYCVPPHSPYGGMAMAGCTAEETLEKMIAANTNALIETFS
jgi:hypothetical protein